MDYYDRQGNPMPDVIRWAKLSETPDYKRVADDNVGGYWISTVWLGLNHRFGEGPPLIFETMVFPAKNGEVTDWGDLFVERYSTEAEAVLGHERVVSAIRAGIDPSEIDLDLSTAIH